MNWTLAIVGLVVLFLLSIPALESLARWWLRSRGRYCVWPPYLRLELHPDPEVLPELERCVRLEFNREGERSDGSVSSGAGLYRILVAGGSPAECALLDQSTSWPGRIERILERPENLHMLRSSGVHVGSIARTGIASGHLLSIFQKVLPQYQNLNCIIVMVGGNDVWNWLQKGAPAIYAPAQIPFSDVFSIYPERTFAWKIFECALRALLNTIRRHAFHPVIVRQQSGRWIGKARAMRARATEVRNSVPDPSNMLFNYERNFRELLTIAKEKADRVLVVRQPWFEKNQYTTEEISHFWQGGIGDSYAAGDITVFYSLTVCCHLMRLMDLRATKVAESLGVEHLDLLPILQPSLRTFYDFSHFTPTGAGVVAEAVSKKLLESYHIRIGDTGGELH